MLAIMKVLEKVYPGKVTCNTISLSSHCGWFQEEMYLASSYQLGLKAAMIWHHLCQSWAAVCASPHERPVSLSSATTVLCQVVLGLPDFLFPGDVHLSAVLRMRPHSIVTTWPSHQSALLYLQDNAATVCLLV